MFSFFSKKIFLKDCISTDLVDIHSHTLPGIDDGAKTLEDTKSLLSQMKDLGFAQIYTSPHTMAHIYPNSMATIQTTHQKVVNEWPELCKGLQYKAISEYMIDEEFDAKVKENQLLTLPYNHVLVEMSFSNPPIFLDDTLFLLISKGYTPILAHPERYNFYKGNLDAFKKLKKMGCKLQINLLSVTGYYGDKIAETADILLANNMYDFAGSDIHHQKHIDAFQMPLVIKNKEIFKKTLLKNQLFKT